MTDNINQQNSETKISKSGKIPDNNLSIKKSIATEMGLPGHHIVNVDNIMGSVSTLLDLLSKQKANKKQLLEDAQDIYIIITLYRITPKKRFGFKPFLINIPHSLHSEEDICFFVKDPAKTYKESFREMGVPNVKKVLGIESLRNKHGQYEARRKLLHSYDLFLCDEKINLVLVRLLGKTFINNKRFPIPVRINKNIAQNVAKARDSSYLHLTSGSCINFKVAKSSMDVKEICENIISSLDQIVSKIPGKWNNIQSLNIKTKDSMAIPFYNNLKSFITLNGIESKNADKKEKSTSELKTE